MYLLSVLVVLVAISMVPTILSDPINQPIGDFTVPSWIKNNAGWWADGQIDDGSFVSGIQWLILNDVITIPSTQQGAGDGWVKNTAGWWAEDKIHDITFVSAIKYLINEGIMIVGQVSEPEPAKCTFKGIPVPCSAVKEVEEITDFYMEINGSNCCLNWAYVGKDYNFQIETFDKKHGNQIDGVTITAKIISKGGELRHDFGQVTTEDGIYKNSITIPSMDWYAENILFVTGEYYGTEKTIEKEFAVFAKKSTSSGCGAGSSPFDISDRDATPNGIAFNSDGTKMFIVGKGSKKVYEYRLCSPYSLDNASYTTSFSISTRVAEPQSLAFNSDGTKMFILDQNTDDVTEYALSTAFDISSASFTTQGCTGIDRGTSNATKATAMDFNDDGTLLRVLHRTGGEDNVMEFTLGTGFSMAGTCSSYDPDTSSDSLTDGKPEGMAFNDDGTKMFILGNQNDNIYEYTLSTAYDVTNDGATLAYTLDISAQDGNPRGLAFNSDGTKMFIVGTGNTNVEINIYSLVTAWDISTATVI